MIFVTPTSEQDEYSYTLHMSGCATTLPIEDEEDIVERLRKCVAEVTRKPVDRPETKRRIGFV